VAMHLPSLAPTLQAVPLFSKLPLLIITADLTPMEASHTVTTAVAVHLPSLVPTLQVVPPFSQGPLLSIVATLHRMLPRRRSPMQDILSQTLYTMDNLPSRTTEDPPRMHTGEGLPRSHTGEDIPRTMHTTGDIPRTTHITQNILSRTMGAPRHNSGPLTVDTVHLPFSRVDPLNSPAHTRIPPLVAVTAHLRVGLLPSLVEVLVLGMVMEVVDMVHSPSPVMVRTSSQVEDIPLLANLTQITNGAMGDKCTGIMWDSAMKVRLFH